MRLLEDNNGISEIVGLMLMLLIGVSVLAIIQAEEVPRLNKDIEMDYFDKMSYDFLSLRSDIDLVAAKSLPIKTNLDLGVRYPERFMLQNPGPGASGTLTFENVSVVLEILNSTGSVRATITLNSTRIRYQLNGISQQPELIYEHGLIIKDYRIRQEIEGSQSIISGNNLNVPIINFPQQSIGGMGTETFTLLPLPATQYNTTYAFLPTRIRLSLTTSYPELWNNTIGTLSGVSVNSTTNIITIDNNVSGLIFPKAATDNYIYSGTISNIVPSELKPGGVSYGSTGESGVYSNEQNANNLVSIPPSSGASKFLINDIQVEPNIELQPDTIRLCKGNGASKLACFQYTVNDLLGNYFKVSVTLKNSTTISSVLLVNRTIDAIPDQKYLDITDSTTINRSIANGINLTTYYQQQNLAVPNSVTLDLWNPDHTSNQPKILYFRWIIT